MDFKKKRWICYGASLILVICAGIQNSLSVFQIPLDEKFGWGIPKIAFAYSILCVAELIVVVFFVGKLREKLGIQKFMILGAVFFGGGIFLCAFISSSVFELYMYQGVMVGIGHAIIYPCLTSYVIQIIPERAGFASGFVVGAYSCGTLVWAPLAANIATSTGDVSQAFFVIGAIMLIALLSLSLLLREPPEGFLENVSKPVEETKNSLSVRDVPRREMLRMPVFYLFYLTFLIPILGGMMVMTQGATIFQYELGVSAGVAATMLGALAICNLSGRMLSAGVFDRLGPTIMMRLFFILQIIGFCGMLFLKNNAFFLASACACLLGFGGFAALMPAMTSRLFGVKYLTENFGIIFTIYSIGGFLAPALVSNLRQFSGGYTLSFSIILALTIIGFFFSEQLSRVLLRQGERQMDVNMDK